MTIHYPVTAASTNQIKRTLAPGSDTYNYREFVDSSAGMWDQNTKWTWDPSNSRWETTTINIDADTRKFEDALQRVAVGARASEVEKLRRAVEAGTAKPKFA